ncbi:hypothetical protein DMH02_022150 [Streptomyces sp. WAC 00631]|uniref:hypothetical protein n=1 Tax=Streptomyces sp. WAC 00631 TaxID=2203201 RepID=UPI000F7B4BAD|nr:hypothetical protein [Streptomyces sp. WAC 00631]MCC5035839.1 hypothetical protein [Streptomyces sp. WAC 00631]
MSAEDEKPELTPEEQQKADAAEIRTEFGAADMMERMPDFFRGAFGLGPGKSVFGRTDFEGAQLNAMLDLLETANPSDLAEAGESLKKVTKALNEAAEELERSVAKTDWTGEAATKFQKYGRELVTYAWGLGTFANAVGTQMTVAGTGLSSVRGARPPRDGRIVQKKPEDFSAPERTQDNPEYQKALQVEKDRQEAINQMNRLASFYAVSEERLASQEPPKPPGALNAPVPPPLIAPYKVGSGPAAANAGTSDPSQPRAGIRESDATGVTGASHTGIGLDGRPPVPSPSMEIDSVQAPPAPTAPPGPAPTAPAPGTAGDHQVPSMGPNFGSPARNLGTSRASGTQGSPRPGGSSQPRAYGRPGPAGGPASTPPGRATGTPGRPGMPGASTTGQATGRPGPMGRPGSMGTPANATGRTPATSTRGQTPVGGRPGMPGQTSAGRPGGATQDRTPAAGRPGPVGRPTAGGPGSPAGPRVGRGGGIVGGTPQPGTVGPAKSRTPRGTVVGGAADTTRRASGARPHQQGVIGANPPRGVSPAAGRGAPSSRGVVGGTGVGGTGSRAGSQGTAAGERSGQRPAGQGPSGNEDRQRPEPERPDHLTEDEWMARRRGAVPPVIE